MIGCMQLKEERVSCVLRKAHPHRGPVGQRADMTGCGTMRDRVNAAAAPRLRAGRIISGKEGRT